MAVGDDGWAPWSEGHASRSNDGKTVVGTTAMKQEYTEEGWMLKEVSIDESGIFFTSVFVKEE
jgi:hypothetical protein